MKGTTAFDYTQGWRRLRDDVDGGNGREWLHLSRDGNGGNGWGYLHVTMMEMGGISYTRVSTLVEMVGEKTHPALKIPYVFS